MRRLLAAGLALLSIAACADGAEEKPPPASAPSTTPQNPEFQADTAVYRCSTADGEILLVTRTRPNGLHVFLPPELEGGYLDCEHDRRASIWEHAKLNGVSFRAVGNEPGWVLEVRQGERLDLSYDYGQSTLRLPIVETDSDPEARTTIIVGAEDDRRLVVTLTGGGCSDTMSDETFPTRVELAFGERKLSGCGRPLH